MLHADQDTLLAGLATVADSPTDCGPLRLIVARPAPDERRVLDQAELDLQEGLVGDAWRVRGSRRTPDGTAHPGMQVTLMNARAAALIAGPVERWPLAGDQLYVDLHLGPDTLPAGTQLELGNAVLEVTDEPHTGCAKFAQRFGREAARLVNTPEGLALRLRGINTRVVQAGHVTVGDLVRRA